MDAHNHSPGGVLILNLDLIYTHRGLDYDFPLRILSSVSNHPELKCSVVDIVVYKNQGTDTEATNAGDNGLHREFSLLGYCEKFFLRDYSKAGGTRDQLGGAGTPGVTFNCKLRLKLTYTCKHIPLDAAVLFQIGLSIKNNYGRRCTREGGMCYVTMLELFGNLALGKREGDHRCYYALRPICCSAANYKARKWIGSLAVALNSKRMGGQQPVPLESLSPKCQTYVNHYIIPACELHTNETVMGVDGTSLRSFCEVRGARNVDVDVDLLKALFGINLHYPDSQDYKVIFGKSTKNELVTKALEKQNAFLSKATWHANFQRIKNHDRLVFVDLEKTIHMKCPLAPMDACLWQECEPYGLDYYYRDDIMNSLLVSSEYTEGIATTGEGSSVFSLNQRYLKRYLGEIFEKQPRNGDGAQNGTLNVASRLNGAGEDHRSDLDAKMNRWFSNFKNPGRGTRLYLPFYAFLNVPRLTMHGGFWMNALSILIGREEFKDYVAFQTYFFHDTTTPYTRAMYAFKLICLYPQCFEYLSDFSVKSASNINADTGDGDTHRHQPVIKEEVEQFWNCFVSMVADCEDSSLGIYQSYYAFVIKPSRKTLIEQRQCPVLCEMRRVLRHNYLIFLNIEGVHLYRQTNSSKSIIKHRRGSEGCSINAEYYKHTKGINSAHAAVKLIPKLYFERCVNRSMALIGKSPVFTSCCSSPSNSPCGINRKPCLCAYHRYAPDIYNDELDILLGEGTSKLSSGFEKPWCKYKWFAEAMADNSLINDVTKTTIYPKKKGSNFYKASFFGITPYFMCEYGVSTFKYCRPIDDYAKVNDFVKRNYKFLKGVSYVQLCRKDERIMMVPAGEYLDSAPTKVATYKPCDLISFNERESTPEMEKTVLKESPFRMKGKKLEKVRAMVDVMHARTQYAAANPVESTTPLINCPYNMIIDDTLHKLDKNRERMATWTNFMNATFNRASPTLKRRGSYDNVSNSGDIQKGISVDPKRNYISYSLDEYPGGHYNLFVDNYYITDKFLDLIRSTLAKGLENNGASHTRVLTKSALEELSNDMRIWKITFYIK